MLSRLEGEFSRIGKPGMAKIAAGMLEELEAQGIGDIPFPSTLFQDVQNNLVENNPTETVHQSDLPPFVFHKSEGILRHVVEIDALDITVRTRNTLVRAGTTKIRELYDASDELILDIRGIGGVGLVNLREGLTSFRDKVILERQKLGIEDDTPVILPHPTKSIH